MWTPIADYISWLVSFRNAHSVDLHFNQTILCLSLLDTGGVDALIFFSDKYTQRHTLANLLVSHFTITFGWFHMRRSSR